MLGSAAVSEGSSRPSLPAANTTSPPQSTYGRMPSMKVRVTESPPVQYSPPQELLEIRAPLAIRSSWGMASQEPSVTSLPRPEPSSSGGASEMIRAETKSAPWAMPPGRLPNGAPPAICATAVPWPSTSSVSRSLLYGSR